MVELKYTKSRGVLLTVEGIDGSGKTTIAKMLKDYFSSLGLKAHYTAEPTRSPIGEIIRERVFKAEERVDPYLEALLFATDRRYHVKFEIEPAIESGQVVVCDRYVHSSIAYQGALGAPISWIREINEYILKPDLAVYLDVPPEVGLKRIRKPRVATFENVEYLSRVREIYLELVESGELVLVDSTKSVREVFEEVLRVIRESKVLSSS